MRKPAIAARSCVCLAVLGALVGACPDSDESTAGTPLADAPGAADTVTPDAAAPPDVPDSGDVARADVADAAGDVVVPSECGLVAFEGCCTPEGAVLFCEDDELWQDNCDGGGCGWNPQYSAYDCVGLGEASGDASFPFLCQGYDYECVDPCAGRECGHDCGVACGSCTAGEAICELLSGQCLECTCAGLECGTDFCGNACGTCADATFCSSEQKCEPCSCEGAACGEDGCGVACGTCADSLTCDPRTRQCVEAPCAGLGAEGCCEGTTNFFCLGGDLDSEVCTDTCGWDPTEEWYGCGFTGEDPTGTFAKTCPAKTK